MNVFLYRVFILAMFACFASSIAEAQKTKKPKKPLDSKLVKETNSSAKVNLSPLESAILTEINRARAEPQKFVAILEDYRKYMKGSILALPNKTQMQMIEGLPAIDEAIRDLRKQEKVSLFEMSGGLSKVARQQLTDLQENPKLKHFGKDGSNLEMRLLKVGLAGDPVAENISYRVDTALEVVLTMIIDDGYKSRSHRKNIFSKSFNVFGVACGVVAADKSTICVAEFANTFKEK